MVVKGFDEVQFESEAGYEVLLTEVQLSDLFVGDALELNVKFEQELGFWLSQSYDLCLDEPKLILTDKSLNFRLSEVVLWFILVNSIPQ